MNRKTIESWASQAVDMCENDELPSSPANIIEELFKLGYIEDGHSSSSYEKLISRQSVENAELRDEISLLKEKVRKINKILYSIGGPLNDNILEYSKEQLSTFFSISNVLEGNI